MAYNTVHGNCHSKKEKGTFYFSLDSVPQFREPPAMPRTARASVADYCYHVLNRGNGRGEVFHKRDD